MDKETRVAQAKALYARPPGKNLPNQKFPRGARVKVDDEMPSTMSHFEKGFEGIVQYTYAQKYWGDNVRDYSLVQLDPDGKPINTIAWYDESQLTLLSDDVETGLDIIEAYHYPKQGD